MFERCVCERNGFLRNGSPVRRLIGEFRGALAGSSPRAARAGGGRVAAAALLAWLVLFVPAGWLAAPTARAQAAAAETAPEGSAPTPAPVLVAVVEEQSAADRDAKAAQERIDQIDDETDELLSQYRQLMSEAASFKAYSDQLAIQVQSQLDEIESTNAELDEIETTTREVLPLMQNMLDTLERFVELDVPFLLDERGKRVTGLKEMMGRADVSVSEKYRRIVEAYLVEMEYGRTIEAYEGQLGADDDRTVQMLRIGRLTLLYQTMDGKETGYWDAGKKAWVVDNHYAHGFKEGIRVAKKLGAPDILIAPVSAPKEDS